MYHRHNKTFNFKNGHIQIMYIIEKRKTKWTVMSILQIVNNAEG